MSISERATASIRPIPRDPNDISRLREEWRLLAKQHNDAEDRASRYEEGRKLLLAQLKLAIIETGYKPLSAAEDKARTSEEFKRYLAKMHDARRIANDLRTEVENANRLYWERNNAEATERSERRMSR